MASIQTEFQNWYDSSAAIPLHNQNYLLAEAAFHAAWDMALKSRTPDMKLSSYLDKVADSLQEQGLTHEAEEIDAISNAIERYSMDSDLLAAAPKEDGPKEDGPKDEEPTEISVETNPVVTSPVDTVLCPYNKPTELKGDDLEVFEEIVKNIIESNGFQDIDIQKPFIVLVRGSGSYIKNALRNAFPKLRMPKAVAVMRYGTRNCGICSDDIKAV